MRHISKRLMVGLDGLSLFLSEAAETERVTKGIEQLPECLRGLKLE
ncbi:MAG: hypothetical protein IPK99_16685 [Flavobacteriales bacterium]|nr:hypothetical protein [Flavobacteriales bacterium]